MPLVLEPSIWMAGTAATEDSCVYPDQRNEILRIGGDARRNSDLSALNATSPMFLSLCYSNGQVLL